MEEVILKYVEESIGSRVVEMYKAYDRMGYSFILKYIDGNQSQYYLDEGTIRWLWDNYKKSQQMSNYPKGIGQYVSTGQLMPAVPNDYIAQAVYQNQIRYWSSISMGAPINEPKPKAVLCARCNEESCSGTKDLRGRCEFKSKKFAEKVRVLHQHRKRDNAKTTS